jgi:DNA-binding MarR family transcriptional regulator
MLAGGNIWEMTDSEPRPEITALARALRDLVVSGDQLRRAIAAHDGLGLSEFMTLSQLYFSGEAGPSDLARNLGLTPGSMTLLLDRLEVLGYVRRLAHPSDRRRQIVAITDGGAELHQAAFARFAEAVADAVGDEGVADVVAVTDFVDAAVRAVRARAEGLS